MTREEEVITQLMEYCDGLFEMVDELKAHNAFLTETMVKHNLQEIVEERRNLLQIVEDAKKSKIEADKVKDEYQKMLDTLNLKLGEVEKKEKDLDSYISAEAEKRITSIKNNSLNEKKRYEEEIENIKMSFEVSQNELMKRNNDNEMSHTSTSGEYLIP